MPEKDWRQSWAKTDDKPLQIADKPAAKDSIADVPPLRIEGKVPTKDIVFDVTARESAKASDKSVAKQQVAQPKGAPSPDDPLLNPEKYMPKVLDMTPRTKVSEPTPARVPTIADLAGARPEPKIKPAAAIVPTGPVAAQPNLAPSAPVAATSPTVVFDVSKSAGPVTVPAMPAPAGSAIIPMLPVASDKPLVSANPGKSPDKLSASSAPVIPLAPLGAAATPPPNVSNPRLASSSPSVASAPAARSERPNFLVMDGARAESSDGSIKLPGMPNAVVAFGQPVTVTAPPPDMVRKKSLEAHSIQVMMTQLKESLYPSQREWAAEGLTSANWKVHPQVVDALCAAAQNDPAPTVRCRCARKPGDYERANGDSFRGNS